MDKLKNPKSGLSETIIVLLILICITLVLVELSSNVINEIQTTRKAATMDTSAPAGVVPTPPAGMTPTPAMIIGWKMDSNP